jgi:hypothetical protein
VFEAPTNSSKNAIKSAKNLSRSEQKSGQNVVFCEKYELD